MVLHETLLVPVLTYGSKNGRRRRDLRLGLYRWSISEAGLILEGWIEYQMHG